MITWLSIIYGSHDESLLSLQWLCNLCNHFHEFDFGSGQEPATLSLFNNPNVCELLAVHGRASCPTHAIIFRVH